MSNIIEMNNTKVYINKTDELRKEILSIPDDKIEMEWKLLAFITDDLKVLTHILQVAKAGIVL